MDSFENWVASLSGQIKRSSPDGLVELDEAGINVFEVKKKEPLPESTAASVLSNSTKSLTLHLK